MEVPVQARNFSNGSVDLGQEGMDDTVVTTLLGAILTIMCLFGISGNLYTLVISNISMKSVGSMYVYVVNLAFADLLYLSTIPFVVCTYFVHDWFFGDIGCRILLSLDLLTMHASIFILTVMSLERYKAVSRPLKTRLSKTYRKMTSLFIWLLSLLLTLPMMAMIHLRESDQYSNKRICFPTWTPEGFKVYLTILFTTSILAPGLIIGYLYSRLAIMYWASDLKLLTKKRRTLKQKVYYRIFSIILAYWACFVPFWTWQLVKLYFPGSLNLTSGAQVYLNFGVTCLTYGNSCINPLLYTLLTRNYREYLANRARGSSSIVTRKGHHTSQSEQVSLRTRMPAGQDGETDLGKIAEGIPVSELVACV
ncbi:urotensin-2 receptor-like [Microcaecilia unicolor]|uniref:Urotensin-2 receptor n=1 Tax=Microcaecilia unicolor TaxID=1415580 RepID=A0A6P7Z325_9AMPH|nr:urotensin-2 receptor-like [Microcaecilia unicolor]